MPNPFLSSQYHDEDLHSEWLRFRHEGLAAAQAGDTDLRDSLAMKLQQVEDAIYARSRPAEPAAQR